MAGARPRLPPLARPVEFRRARPSTDRPRHPHGADCREPGMSVTHVTAIVAALVAFAAQTPISVPVYKVDPAWPKPLPNHWLVGAVVGVAVDRQDHIWMAHRPSTLQPNETRSFWRAAPPVLEFDQQGTVVSSWGGPGAGYEWP